MEANTRLLSKELEILMNQAMSDFKKIHELILKAEESLSDILAIANITIDELEITDNTKRMLIEKVGVKTALMLTCYSQESLLKYRGIGIVTIKEITIALGKYGVSLKSPNDRTF